MAEFIFKESQFELIKKMVEKESQIKLDEEKQLVIEEQGLNNIGNSQSDPLSGLFKKILVG